MGLFKWIGNALTDFSSEREETYKCACDASWNCIYDMLKGKNVFSAKAQGLMSALGEKLEAEDSYILQQFYENEVRHSAEKTNPCGFMVLKKEIERRGAY